MSETTQEVIMHKLLGLGAEYSENPYNETELDADVQARMVEVISPLSGAIQIDWDEIVSTCKPLVKTGRPVFAIAYREWDRTHGLSVEVEIADCFDPEVAAGIVRMVYELHRVQAERIAADGG